MTVQSQLAAHFNVDTQSVHSLGSHYYQIQGKKVMWSQLNPISDEKTTGANVERLHEADFYVISVEEHRFHSTPRALFVIPTNFIVSRLSQMDISKGRAWIKISYVDFEGWCLKLKNGQHMPLSPYEKEVYTNDERKAVIKGLNNIISE